MLERIHFNPQIPKFPKKFGSRSILLFFAKIKLWSKKWVGYRDDRIIWPAYIRKFSRFECER